MPTETDSPSYGIARITRLGQVISHPVRVRILTVVQDHEVCLCDLMTMFGLSKQTVSNHVMILLKAKLIRRERRKNWYYYMPAQSIENILIELRHGFHSILELDPVIQNDLQVRDPAGCDA